MSAPGDSQMAAEMRRIAAMEIHQATERLQAALQVAKEAGDAVQVAIAEAMIKARELCEKEIAQ